MIPIDTTGLPPGATFGTGPGAAGPAAAPDAVDFAATTFEGATVAPGQPSLPRAGGPLVVGQSFGPRYHIIRLLGTGGMGAVYQAWDAELSVAVALKVIRANTRRGITAAVEKRFKNELLLARQVTHKNVVRIHDLGEIDGIKYITMPFVQGDDLAGVLRRDGKLPIARALRLARQIAGGLEAAHDAGVVHRDLKPANIMIGASGDDVQAQIMDFGISATSGDTSKGGVLGTLEYMAPEQGTGGVVDARADIYAFGLILYEMLTGPRVVGATTPQDRLNAMTQRFAEGVAPVRTLDDSIPEPLNALVMRCIEKDPAARFQTSHDLTAALDALDDAGELLPIPARISKRVLALTAVLIVALLAGTYVVGSRAVRVTPPAHEPVPVLIADFENRSGDPVFEGSVEQTLALALEGASYITVFKTSDARAIAARLAPGQGNRITLELGQLISQREGLKVLLTGAIDKTAGGYRLELRAIDPATGKPIASSSRDVTDKAQVLNAAASMATTVREALGESKSEMTKLAAAETATAASLEAMGAYARGQELSRSNKIPEALQAYEEAVRLDPGFGRAYAGMGVLYSNLKQQDKAEAAYAQALKYVGRMTDREKYRTLGGYYLLVVRNYESAIENYETLVRLYPADTGGHGNLALALLNVGNMQRAVAEVRKSLEIYPRNRLQRYNYAMYSMYAGDFATAIAEGSTVLKESPSFEYPFIPVAVSNLAEGHVDAAREAYARLEQLSPLGAAFASIGKADLEMYFGRYKQALAILQAGIAADERRKGSAELSREYVAAAEAHLALGQRRLAIASAEKAAELSRHEGVLFAAARALLLAGDEGQAEKIGATLDNMLQRRPMAYARLISAEIAIRQGRVGAGIESVRESQKRHDSWFARFLLGKTYVEAGHYPEALKELELCVKRRGEAADMFIDDLPTLRYLPPAYYWLARTQEALGVTAEARKNYDQFLKLRGDADPADPLAADARRRMDSH